MVSASGCGPEGRGFESHISPQKKKKHRTVRAKARAYRSARTVSKRGVRADICTPGGAFFQTRLCAEGKTESTPRRADRKAESGCSAVGSARGLGACDRLISRPPKAREISVFLAFPRFSAAVCFGKKLLTTDLTTYGFDRKIEYFHPSGCGAVGSARSLGLRCRRFEPCHSDQKSAENEVFRPTFG